MITQITSKARWAVPEQRKSSIPGIVTRAEPRNKIDEENSKAGVENRRTVRKDQSKDQTAGESVVSKQSGQVPTSILDQLKAQLQQKDVQIRVLRQDWRNEVREHCEIISKLEQQLNDTRAQKNATEMASKASNAGLEAGKNPVPLVDMIAMLTDKLRLAELSAKEKSILSSFAQRTPMQKNVVDKAIIKDEFDGIAWKLESIFNDQNPSSTMRFPNCESDTDLGRLACHMSGVAMGSDQEMAYLKRYMLKLGPDIFMRNLVIASLKAWVFDTNFPSIAGNNNVLLDAYRSIIYKHGMFISYTGITSP
jgi:hypothetical protein